MAWQSMFAGGASCRVFVVNENFDDPLFDLAMAAGDIVHTTDPDGADYDLSVSGGGELILSLSSSDINDYDAWPIFVTVTPSTPPNDGQIRLSAITTWDQVYDYPTPAFAYAANNPDPAPGFPHSPPWPDDYPGMSIILSQVAAHGYTLTWIPEPADVSSVTGDHVLAGLSIPFSWGA